MGTKVQKIGLKVRKIKIKVQNISLKVMEMGQKGFKSMGNVLKRDRNLSESKGMGY